MEKKVLAFDFGASGGRAMCGTFDGTKITLEEIHRFSNDPIIVNGTMYWDTLRLFFEIKQGLIKSKKYGKMESLGIDTWGVDFGLLDKAGRLLENPVHYRDARTAGLVEKSFEKIPKERFYQITGNQFMELNTVFQLFSLVENRKDLLERVDTFLLTPDLFNYFLTGEKAADYSMASTTQMMDANTGEWSAEVIEALGIPQSILPTIVSCGTKVGVLTDDICEELDINQMDVVAIAGHDTQSALVAVPAKEEDFVFLSCGTWSLFGTELPAPLINEKSAHYNITNEGGYDKKVSFMKNIIGLWCIQESRRQWIREGKEYGFGELEAMALEAKPFKCFIDADAPEFTPAGNIPRRIREYCERTQQEIPETAGEIVRCINESLAFKYRMALEEIKDCTGKEYQTVYMVGGGTQSKLLCQFTSSACRCKVSAGPIEGTALGNVAIQLMAAGDIASLQEAREIVAHSSDMNYYQPQNESQWEEAFMRFKSIIGKGE